MKRRCGSLVAVVTAIFAGCDPSDWRTSVRQASDQVVDGYHGAPCESPGTVVRSDTGTVVIHTETATCTIAFREVVTLRGTEDGTLPRVPVALGPGGTYLTATYNPAEIAFWTAGGEVERLITKQEGDGPGDLRRVGGLVLDTLGSRLYVLTAGRRIDVFSLDGTFQHRISTHVVSPNVAAPALLADGSVVMRGTYGKNRPILTVARGERVDRVGPAQKYSYPPFVEPGHNGVWSAELLSYEINHHSMPDGRVDFRLRREVPWFPDGRPEDGGMRLDGRVSGVLMDFAVDESRGLVFAKVQTRDPDAPGPWKAMMEEGGPMPQGEELRRQTVIHLDALLEVFTLDGRLIASRRYDHKSEAPLPITAHRFYHVDDSGLIPSIQILEPVLVQSPK